jgi:hypothetical protein
VSGGPGERLGLRGPDVTDWTRQLLAHRKERLLIGGADLERPCNGVASEA